MKGDHKVDFPGALHGTTNVHKATAQPLQGYQKNHDRQYHDQRRDETIPLGPTATSQSQCPCSLWSSARRSHKEISNSMVGSTGRTKPSFTLVALTRIGRETSCGMYMNDKAKKMSRRIGNGDCFSVSIRTFP
ncbi:hypothetical protein MLD38_005951 [Melastoma candidum]|uniref:Uncharacterized protein n=1 Tax=Melastoma candidum TaxID=119954 RepID=A0ACB9RUS2_9MYRT|nr:hypothetical protein MLD38_005951 [Melastoma candidum]